MYQGHLYVFATIAVLGWIPFALILFANQKPVRAAFHTLIWSWMWLPNGAAFDLPILPPLTKFEISALVALVGLIWKAPKRVVAAKIGRGYDAFIWIGMSLLYFTVQGNAETLHYGNPDIPKIGILTLEPFKLTDLPYATFEMLFQIMVPMWLGRILLRSREDAYELLRMLSLSGLIYGIPIMWELRMSPNLQQNLYGFVDHSDFSQNMRGGGYRATVFMGHGLIVAFFEFLAFMSTLLLAKFKKTLYGLPSWMWASSHFVLLVLCKSAGASIFGALTLAVFWLKPKRWVQIGTLLSLLVISYPVARIMDWFPVQSVLDFSTSVLGTERTQSMKFRYDNEDMLLARGQEKFWFGWGGFSRENAYDKDYAKLLTVQDGHWIIVFGQRGMAGFICQFSVIVIPLFGLRKRMRKLNVRDQVLLGGLVWMLAICNVNVVPNMSLPNMHLIIAMGITILARELVKKRTQAKSVERTVLRTSKIGVSMDAWLDVANGRSKWSEVLRKDEIGC